MTAGALNGVRVLDLSQDVAGSFCGRLLGDFGADVVKVEPAAGAALRRQGPFHGDDPHPEKSLLFFVLNVNKRGVTLTLEASGGAELLKKLAADADVVVESFKPGYLDSLGGMGGVGYEALREVNPRLVFTSITPFGQTGPYSEYEGGELQCYAMSTIMSISGTRDREPLKHGGFQSQYEGGLNGAGATTMALFHQSMTGEGQHLDVCITECVASTMLATQSMYAYTGGVQARRAAVGTLFGNPMACADGWVIGQTGGGATWDTQVDFYGKEELRDARFSEAGQRINNGAEMDALMEEGIKDRGRWELFHEASKNRMLFGLVQTPEDMASCAQLESRGFYREIEHPVMGHVRLPAVLLNMSATPYELRRTAPLLGQHNVEVYRELGIGPEELARLRRMDVI